MSDGPGNAQASKSAGNAVAPRVVTGNTLFFPAASLYALFALPVSVVGVLGVARVPPGIAFAAGHAHEMLFGFALAAVAGNQLGPVSVPRLAALFALWMLARASFLAAPASLAAVAANIAFAAVLAAQIAPRMLRAAKKPRNKALPAVLIAICASEIAFQLASRVGADGLAFRILLCAVVLFALLMLFMGGRLIAPAVAGQFYRQGGNLEARVQPRIESALIVAMAFAATTSLVPSRPWLVASGVCAIAAGALATARLARWRLWALRGRPDLLCLASGYAWLATGLIALGAALASARELTVALHVITVGSIGTLTLNVMAMTWLLKARKDPARNRAPVWGTVLLAAATLLRVLGGIGGNHVAVLLLAAALCWSGAFALLAGLLWVARKPARPPR